MVSVICLKWLLLLYSACQILVKFDFEWSLHYPQHFHIILVYKLWAHLILMQISGMDTLCVYPVYVGKCFHIHIGRLLQK